MRPQALLLALLLCLVSIGSLGCISDTLRDDLTTEISINNPGGAQAPFEIQKRFKFTHNPAEAVFEPKDIIAQLHKGERVLIAEASGFAPDTTYADLNIVYKDDLHPFLTEDGLMDLIIRVEPNGWYPARHDLILITTTATISFDL